MRFLLSVLPLLLSLSCLAGDEPQDAPSSRIVAGDVPGTIRFAGSRTSFGMGGFVRLHMMYSDSIPEQHGWGNQRLWVPDIAVSAARETADDDFTLHAKESRLWLRSYTSSRWGDVETLVEYDLLKLPGSYQPRLRHAFISVGQLLAGQTFTTFTNTASIPDIDAATAVGSVITRQPMLRWTRPLGEDGLQLLLALEESESRVINGSAPRYRVSGDEDLPDLVMKLELNRDWGSVSLAGMARQLALQAPEQNIDDERWGGAISVAGRLNTGVLDNVRFMFNYGNALGRYSTLATFSDAFVRPATGTSTASTSLKGNTVHSGLVAFQHFWNANWRSNIALSYSLARLPDFVAGELTRESRSAHINLIWSPVSQVSMGLEYLYGMRQLNNGHDGELNRMQFSTRIAF